MKTLRNYVVNGQLQVGDTGAAAQVGDQVRLYLDVEAYPAFPEYVVGTIQHPVVAVQCNSATSYSVEYDEADLRGAKSSLIVDDVIDAEVITAYDVLVDAMEAQFQTGTFSNSTGNTTITIPEGCERYTVYGTFTGVASTRVLILDTTNAIDGCEITVVAELPATADIILDVRNATEAGTQLDTVTTDTSGDNAVLRFGFTTVWNKINTQYPN